MSSLHYPIEVPKYCAICQKGPFSSGCNAQAHFTSIQHKEAEKSKQSSTNHQFFCKVCSEQCNGPKSFMEHMASPRHKVRQEKSQQFQMSAEREETHDRPYDFDGKRGYCYICRVDLTSKESASQHLNGDNHRKKLQQSQSCKQSNNNCNACRITFPNDDSAEQHFISVHQKSRSDPHSSLNMSMNLRESFGACLIPEEKPQSDDELDKLFQNFQVDLQNETPPQSVIENLQRHSASGSRPFEINSNRNKDVEYTFSISRGFCNVCQVDLTSIKHRDQHLSGVKHNKARQSWLAKRKGNVQNVSKMKEDPVQPMEEPVMSGSSLLEEVEYIFEGGQGFCNVCKLELSSIEHASEHLNSTKHKNAKEDWIQQDVSLSINHRSVDKMEDSIIKPHPFLQTSHITQKSPTVTTTSTVSNSPLFPLPSTPDKPGYVFTGNRGYCNICSLELTSKQHADQHLSGAKHLKAKAAANVPLSPNNPVASQIQIRSTDIDYTFEGSRGFCYICNLELTSKLHANQHLSGAKHNKAKNATQGLTPNLANVSKKLGRTERADPERGNQEYTFNGSKGYCNVCKIELTSKSYAENHLHGKPHNKARQRWMQGYRENVALFCEVCRIPCSGPESMQQHLASKKHKDRVEVITGEVKDSPIGTSDNTKWFFCDICKCKLNSQQQLEAHQQSPKHTAQEEKLLKQGRSAVTLQNVDTTYEGINPTYRQSGQNYDYTGNQMQGYLNDFQKRNTYESRFVNNNAGPSENQFNQYVGNYLQMSPNVEGNVNMMPSYVKPLQNILDRSPLPPNIELPKPSVLSAKRTVKESMQVNFAPPSNEIENLPPFDSFNPSLGSALTLGSLRHGDSFFKVDDERSMIEMARPNVLRTDSMENDMAVEIAHGVNSYHNLDFKQTNLKSSIPMIDNLPIKIRRNNVDTDTAESVNRENISESTAFKSAIDEITSKLSYHHRGHPDGGDSDDEDTNHSSEIFYKKSSFNSKQCEKEIIVPEITTDVVPMNGDSHFIVDDPAELMSSSDNSSHSRKSANTDMSRAIKNRHKSKPSQVSLSSQTDSSIERISENQSQISLSSQTDTSIESSESENFYSGVIKNVFHSDSNNKNNNENEPLKVEENLSDRSIKSPGTSLENTCNLTSQIAGTSGRNPDSNSPYLYYCQTCKRPMNTEKIYKEHVRGQRHLDKVAVESAPDREHPPIKSFNDYGRIGFNLTNTKPRSYQIELFSKTLECDRVCFLPTGS